MMRVSIFQAQRAHGASTGCSLRDEYFQGRVNGRMDHVTFERWEVIWHRHGFFLTPSSFLAVFVYMFVVQERLQDISCQNHLSVPA